MLKDEVYNKNKDREVHYLASNNNLEIIWKEILEWPLFKNQGIKERIAEETQDIKNENADLARQMKNLFRANKVGLMNVY